MSALITAEWYMRKNHFPGWARPFEFNAHLYDSIGRHEEARDGVSSAICLVQGCTCQQKSLLCNSSAHMKAGCSACGYEGITDHSREVWKAVCTHSLAPSSLTGAIADLKGIALQARVALRLPWWTLKSSFQEIQQLAQLEGDAKQVQSALDMASSISKEGIPPGTPTHIN